MKRIIFFLLFLPLLQNAQSFHRGAVILDVGTGLEYYNTSKRYNNLLNLTDTSIGGQAAGVNLNAGLEIGLSKRIGIGARGRLNTFFKELDAVTQQQTKMQTVDLLMNISLHPIHRRKFDLALGTNFGISSVDMTFQNFNQLLTNGQGLYSDLFIMPRFYWKRVGVNIRIYKPFASYRTLVTTGEQLNSQQFSVASWKGTGLGVNVGLQLRIF